MFDERVYELRFYKYLQGVKNGEIVSNKNMMLLAIKLLNDIEKSKEEDYPYYFDVDKAIAIDGFIGCLRFTEGLKVGQAIKLADFQDNIIKNTFCWRLKEDPTITRFNDIIVFIPRKNGKSFICALLGILATMLEENAEVLNGAGKLEQAKILVKQAMRLIQSNPNLSKHFKIYKNYIEFKGSIFKPVANNATSMDGANPNTIMCDEAQIVERALMESLTSGFMQRKSYQCFYISTEYAVDMKTQWLDEMIDYSKKVLEGILEDDRILPIIYSLDNAEEVNNPELWIKANPILNTIPNTFLQEQYKKSVENPFMMKNTLIKNFNVTMVAGDDDAYLNIEKWKACGLDEIDFTNKEVYLGIDLSKTTDLTAVSIVCKDSDEFLVSSMAFLPEETLTNGKRRESIDYRIMEELGNCIITDGAIVNYEIIEDYIRSLEAKYKFYIKGICFDPYNGLALMSSLAKDYNVVEIKQYKSVLSPPTKDFREKVYLGKVKYKKNQLLDWCVSNAITAEDNNGNEALDKRKSKNRIDMIAAVIFAYVEAMKAQDLFNVDDFFVV